MPLIDEGFYYIRNRASRTILRVSGSKEAVVGHSHDLSLLSRQLFRVGVALNDDKRIIIVNVRTNHLLDLDSGALQVPVYARPGDPTRLNQEWTPTEAGGQGISKFYILKNAETGTVLDLSGGRTAEDTTAIGYSQHSRLNQQWEFIRLPHLESGEASPIEIQIWKDRAEEAEKKIQAAEENAAKAEGNASALEQKLKDAEKKEQEAQAKVQEAEKKLQEAEKTAAEEKEKATVCSKKAEELGWKVKALEEELSTEHKSDEAKEQNRQWLRDMVRYFEYRYGAMPDLLGSYPYLSGHVDFKDRWDWVKSQILN